MKHTVTCTQCGNKPDWPRGKSEGFCPACGSLITAAWDAPKTPARDSSRPKKATWMLLGGGVATALFAVLALLIFTGVIPLEFRIEPEILVAASVEGPGFDTPEDAATAYLEALKALDLDAMISTYAIESYVDNFDTAAYIRRLGGYSPSMSVPLFHKSNFAREMNIALRKAELTAFLRYNIQYTFFTWDGAPIENSTGIQLVESDYNRFLSSLQNNDFADKLAELEISEFVKPEELNARYTDDRIRQRDKELTAAYGADDLIDVAAFVQIENTEFLFSATAARYGERWYLFFPGGTISSLISMSSYSAGFARVSELDLSGYTAARREG